MLSVLWSTASQNTELNASPPKLFSKISLKRWSVWLRIKTRCPWTNSKHSVNTCICLNLNLMLLRRSHVLLITFQYGYIKCTSLLACVYVKIPPLSMNNNLHLNSKLHPGRSAPRLLLLKRELPSPNNNPWLHLLNHSHKFNNKSSCKRLSRHLLVSTTRLMVVLIWELNSKTTRIRAQQ